MVSDEKIDKTFTKSNSYRIAQATERSQLPTCSTRESLAASYSNVTTPTSDTCNSYPS